MNAEHTPTLGRPLVRHCPELLKRGPTPAERMSHFAHAGEKLARLLGNELAPLQGGHAPAMRCLPVQECDVATLEASIAPLAGNCLLAVSPGGMPLLVSFQAEGVLRLLDCAFGGPGEVSSPLPEAFPFSAGLMLRRLEELAASALTTALGAEFLPKARSDRFAELPPFPKGTQLAVLTVEVRHGSSLNWNVTIAAPLASLEALFDHGERRPPVRTQPHSAIGDVFGDLPLALSAVLVDMRMPVSALFALRPGQVLPVSVARSVPLRIGVTAIAHGTIGALDDRVAVQVTEAFCKTKDQTP